MLQTQALGSASDVLKTSVKLPRILAPEVQEMHHGGGKPSIVSAFFDHLFVGLLLLLYATSTHSIYQGFIHLANGQRGYRPWTTRLFVKSRHVSHKVRFVVQVSTPTRGLGVIQRLAVCLHALPSIRRSEIRVAANSVTPE